MRVDDLFLHATQHSVEMRRIYLARQLTDITGNIVQYGALKGFFLGNKATWNIADGGPKLLGLYEKEVAELLNGLSRSRHTLIDLGAADGFFGVGMIVTGKFRESHCFEIIEESRKNIAAIAQTSEVANRVHIYGAATPAFPTELIQPGVNFADAVILCDIEGAEFDVLTEACLQELRHAHLIVEIHDFMVPGGREKCAELVKRASPYFHVAEFKTGARDLSGISLIENWNDSDRWLLCSETRAKLMSWLHMWPK